MRKIIVTTFVSLDGVMQAPGGPEEDTSNGFKWGGWTAAHGDAITKEIMGDLMERPFDLLLGRKTYEIFAAYWAFIQDNPIADKFNKIHKFVVSGKPLDLTWANSSLISGEVVAGLRELKNQEGPDLIVYGSGVLIQTLLENGLVDQLYVWTYPVTIGKGKRLFAGGTQPADWKLIAAKIASTGVIVASYEPKGAISLGTVGGVREPSELELKRREKVAKNG